MSKIIKFIVILFLLLGCESEKKTTNSLNDIAIEEKTVLNNQKLIVVDQDYNKALEIALKMNKLIFIDFYTTWCSPCKKLDKLVFRNDSIEQILKKDFILLKYNAENDSIFHLSKKHHIRSYPSVVVLNKNGYVLNKKYGFPGNDFKTLSKGVIEFKNESVALDKAGEVIKGYSNKINAVKYPKFYSDYIDRTNKKINSSEVNEYLNTQKDIFSEEYFSTLWYLAEHASNLIANKTLKNKQKYSVLYGELDTDAMMYLLASGKFDQAISEKSQEKFDEAILYAKKALNRKSAENTLAYYEKEFLKVQNKWDSVFEINKHLKDNGKFDNEYINHFSWQVFKKCDDKKVIKKCLNWMKEVTKEEPIYAYLDTYAHLMFKIDNKEETMRIAQLAIEAAKKENRKAQETEELIRKLLQ